MFKDNRLKGYRVHFKQEIAHNPIIDSEEKYSFISLVDRTGLPVLTLGLSERGLYVDKETAKEILFDELRAWGTTLSELSVDIVEEVK